MANEVICAAWQGITRGSYRPDPLMPPRSSLIAWLLAISWRQSSTVLGRAHRKHELLVADAPGDRTTTTEGEIIARDELNLLAGLLPERRTVLVAHAAGCGTPEIAEAMNENTSTTWSRGRQARLDLLAILRRAARDRR